MIRKNVLLLLKSVPFGTVWTCPELIGWMFRNSKKNFLMDKFMEFKFLDDVHGRGFSERNFEMMRMFYLGYPISQTASAKFKLS